MTNEVSLGDIVPFPCVFIDAELKEILLAIQRCFATERVKSRAYNAEKLADIFGYNNEHHRHVIPCISVRSAFDLFLLAHKFEPNSEIVMSAINIPDMEEIAVRHGLRVVPLDVDIDTLVPKCAQLPELITERTAVILLAHLFGTTFDVEPFLRVARARKNVLFVEDCAESYSGVDGYLGHPESDASFFSFGMLKRRTCFGGAIARIRSQKLFGRMVDLQESFPLQMNSDYLQKLAQHVAIYFCLNVPALMRPAMRLGKWTNWDYQSTIVRWMHKHREELIERIRKRPSHALVVTMARRLGSKRAPAQLVSDIEAMSAKWELLDQMLPVDAVLVGRKAPVRPTWLCPVLVVSPGLYDWAKYFQKGADKNHGCLRQFTFNRGTWHFIDILPDLQKDAQNFSTIMNRLGVDSYTSATQLKAIRSDSRCCCRYRGDQSKTSGDASSEDSSETRRTCPVPHDAEHMIDHVVYFPVNQHVPENYVRVICEAANVSAKECSTLEEESKNLPKSKL